MQLLAEIALEIRNCLLLKEVLFWIFLFFFFAGWGGRGRVGWGGGGRVGWGGRGGFMPCVYTVHDFCHQRFRLFGFVCNKAPVSKHFYLADLTSVVNCV